MYIVQAFIHAKPDAIEAFRDACIANSNGSLQEPGCARFDVIQQVDEPARFVLFEAYYSQDDFESHKKTAHYATWNAAVASMMAEPRYSIKYHSITPDDTKWACN